MGFYVANRARVGQPLSHVLAKVLALDPSPSKRIWLCTTWYGMALGPYMHWTLAHLSQGSVPLWDRICSSASYHERPFTAAPLRYARRNKGAKPWGRHPDHTPSNPPLKQYKLYFFFMPKANANGMKEEVERICSPCVVEPGHRHHRRQARALS
jgi:hypothetical protein